MTRTAGRKQAKLQTETEPILKVKHDPLKDELKALSDALNRNIAASNARIAAEFSTLRQTQAEGRVLAIFIGAHNKETR